MRIEGFAKGNATGKPLSFEKSSTARRVVTGRNLYPAKRKRASEFKYTFPPTNPFRTKRTHRAS